jgi:hypothetical protein
MTRADLKAMSLARLRGLAAEHGLAVKDPLGAWLPKSWLVDVLARRLCPAPKDGAWKPGDVPAH